MITFYKNLIANCLQMQKFKNQTTDVISLSNDVSAVEILADKGIIFPVTVRALVVEIAEYSQIQNIIDYVQHQIGSSRLNLVVCVSPLEHSKDKCVYICENYSNIIHFVYVNSATGEKVYETDFYYDKSKYINDIIKKIVYTHIDE